eukprot:9815663-Karenia_brevis.AAC.1
MVICNSNGSHPCYGNISCNVMNWRCSSNSRRPGGQDLLKHGGSTHVVCACTQGALRLASWNTRGFLTVSPSLHKKKMRYFEQLLMGVDIAVIQE